MLIGPVVPNPGKPRPLRIEAPEAPSEFSMRRPTGRRLAGRSGDSAGALWTPTRYRHEPHLGKPDPTCQLGGTCVSGSVVPVCVCVCAPHGSIIWLAVQAGGRPGACSVAFSPARGLRHGFELGADSTLPGIRSPRLSSGGRVAFLCASGAVRPTASCATAGGRRSPLVFTPVDAGVQARLIMCALPHLFSGLVPCPRLLLAYLFTYFEYFDELCETYALGMFYPI